MDIQAIILSRSETLIRHLLRGFRYELSLSLSPYPFSFLGLAQRSRELARSVSRSAIPCLFPEKKKKSRKKSFDCRCRAFLIPNWTSSFLDRVFVLFTSNFQSSNSHSKIEKCRIGVVFFLFFFRPFPGVLQSLIGLMSDYFLMAGVISVRK